MRQDCTLCRTVNKPIRWLLTELHCLFMRTFITSSLHHAFMQKSTNSATPKKTMTASLNHLLSTEVSVIAEKYSFRMLQTWPTRLPEREKCWWADVTLLDLQLTAGEGADFLLSVRQVFLKLKLREPHQLTVMLTIHPHLVNEHPPTLPIPFVSPPPPSPSPQSLFFSTPHLNSLSLLLLFLLLLAVSFSDSLTYLSLRLCLQFPISSPPLQQSFS